MSNPETTTAQEKQVTIIVNGRPRPVDKGKLSFEAIVRLAFPNATFGPDVEYTVTFSKGPDAKKEGTLTAGHSIEVKEGMIFNVSETNKS